MWFCYLVCVFTSLLVVPVYTFLYMTVSCVIEALIYYVFAVIDALGSILRLY